MSAELLLISLAWAVTTICYWHMYNRFCQYRVKWLDCMEANERLRLENESLRQQLLQLRVIDSCRQSVPNWFKDGECVHSEQCTCYECLAAREARTLQ